MQNIIKLSAAVHELYGANRKKTPTKTIRSVYFQLLCIPEQNGQKITKYVDQLVRSGFCSQQQ